MSSIKSHPDEAETSNKEKEEEMLPSHSVEVEDTSPVGLEENETTDTTAIQTDGALVPLESPPSGVAMVNSEPGDTIPQELKFYAHLKTYPIANSWIRIFHSFPFPRVVRPFLFRLAFSDPIKPYTTRLDDFLNSHLLGSLENSIPQVKTLRLRDIRDVLTAPVTSRLSRGSSFDRTLIEPLRRRARPLNDNLISYINNAYPQKPLMSGELGDRSDELIYAYHIVNGGMNRTRAQIDDRVSHLREVPDNLSKHASEIYRDNQTKRGGDDRDSRVVMMIASLDTARKLLEEGYGFMFQNNHELDHEVPPEL